MRAIFLISILLILSTTIITQSVFCSEDKEMDSIRMLIENTHNDTAKINLLIELFDKSSWTDMKVSEQYAKQALELSLQINYVKGLAYSKYQMAIVFEDYKFDFSESLALESLEHAKAINDSILIARIYTILGNLKSNLNYHVDALTYFNKSLGIYLRHNQDSLAAAIYNNLGILHAPVYGDSLSIGYYLKAAEINRKTRNYIWLTINYMNLGYDYIELGKFKEGLDYLQQSLKIAEEHNLTLLYPGIYNYFSLFALKTKDFKESVKYANKALLASRDQENRLMELGALTSLLVAYNELSDIENAYQYLEQISILKDSINKYNQLKELDLLEMKYKFEEERKQQKLEKALLANRHYRKELTYLIIILGAGLIISTLLFLYIVQRNRVRRKSLEQKTTLLEKDALSKDLEIKNKELTTGVMYSIQKNKVLSSLTEELVEIEKTAIKEETREAINKISKKIRSSLNANAWEEFEIRFHQVHKEFYEKLATKHPKLTPNEKRLCAFLRLDMSSKEISRITGQSLSALQMARIRLRRKLNISNKDINLITFLSQY